MNKQQQLEDIIGHLQLQNQQLQMIVLQKQTITMHNKEIEKALEEIEKTTGDVYKSVGPILVKTERSSLKKDLEEAKEENELNISSLNKQEAKIREKMNENQQKFQELVPSAHEHFHDQEEKVMGS